MEKKILVETSARHVHLTEADMETLLGKGNARRVFGTAKVGDRGQIVIPKEARELFNIRPGDTLLILGEEETGLIVSRPELLSNIANQIFDTVKKEET